MTPHRRTFVLLAAAIAGFALPSCIHKTRIDTTPEGASVEIDGAPVGGTPVIFQTRTGAPKPYSVKIEKPGYKPIDIKLESGYRADLSLLLLLPGIIPYFFSARLEDSYEYPLVPVRGTGGARGTEAAGSAEGSGGTRGETEDAGGAGGNEG